MKLLLFVAVGILIGLIRSYSQIKELVMIYRIPIRRINKLPVSGQVQIIGKADTKNTKSLLKRTNCCLWKIIVEEDQGRHKGIVRIFEKMSAEPFELVDATGRIQVFPANVELMLHDDLSKKANSITPLPPRINETLQSLSIQTTNIFGFQRLLRVYEQIIQPGDEIFVLGELMYEDGVKVIKSTGKFPFFISDYRDYDVISGLFWITVVKIFGSVFFALVAFVFLYAK